MVETSIIIHARADDNYTEPHLEGGRRIVVSRTPDDIEAGSARRLRFLRVHARIFRRIAVRGALRVRVHGGYGGASKGRNKLPVSARQKGRTARSVRGVVNNITFNVSKNNS
ncbi:MAG: hypothetical protein IPH05_18910 [Flavobacteriales bacterium]|nr:hypothetical protein [Flavobacteriales bacterium]